MKSSREWNVSMSALGMRPTRHPKRMQAMSLRSRPDTWESTDIPFLKCLVLYAGGRQCMHWSSSPSNTHNKRARMEPGDCRKSYELLVRWI